MTVPDIDCYQPLIIGIFKTLTGIIALIMYSWLFPIWVRRVGALRVFKITVSVWPVILLMIPIIGVIGRAGGYYTYSVNSGLVLMSLLTRVARLSSLCVNSSLSSYDMANFTPSAIMIMVRSGAPKGASGATFGLLQSVSALGKVLAPVMMV